MSKVVVDIQTIKDAMHAIEKMQDWLGIDLDDDDGYGKTYYTLEEALEDDC